MLYPAWWTFTKSNGKIHHAIHGKIHYFNSHFPLQTVSSPEGKVFWGFEDDLIGWWCNALEDLKMIWYGDDVRLLGVRTLRIWGWYGTVMMLGCLMMIWFDTVFMLGWWLPNCPKMIYFEQNKYKVQAQLCRCLFLFPRCNDYAVFGNPEG